MSTGMLMGIITIVIMACFIAVVLYTFVYRSKSDFDDQARIPLEEDRDGAEREKQQ